METVHWEQINNDQFSVFIRDLSTNTNTNLKHMIEDIDNQNCEKTLKKDKKKHKKKDLIIQENEKRKYKQLLLNDEKKIEFLLNEISSSDPFQSIQKLKTTEIKNKYKLLLLEHFWKHKKENLNNAFILYYHMKDNFKNEKIIQKIQKKLVSYDCKTYMFDELGHLLPPLNFWNQEKKTLDDWQIKAIQLIKKKQSCLVKAPTSSGKTFVAMATGILFKKILYVCPAKPVAYQVGANYVKMGYKVHYLLENHSTSFLSNDTNIYIGTPDMIEKYLYKIGTNFDYAVYDEIHNLNEYDIGLSYENIIKLVDCNFLALSATIENIEFLKSIFERYHPQKEINEIIYNQRFINQQRWNYQDNNITMIHPICCLEIDKFDEFQYISFTPKDSIQLYQQLEDTFDDLEDELIESYSPDEIFKEDKLLTLNDSKLYESKIKELLKILSEKYPEKIKTIIQSHLSEFNYSDKSDSELENELLNLFTIAKKKDMLPMIYFHTNQETVFELFTKLDSLLYHKEKENYPFHYHILEKRKELYDKYKNDRETFESKIKITTKNATYEKMDKLKEYDKKQRLLFIQQISEYYDLLFHKCKTEKQKNNLKREKKEFLQYPSFSDPDIHIKHKDYCFTNISPMSGNDIRQIKRELKKTCNLNIDYESPLFQLLKRGIGIYIESMPDKYNWILQKLMSEKKLGIVLSSKILCLGIDLPIRTVCLSGYKNPQYSTSDYLQMTGRAGRRGHDNQGNIIFHNIPNTLDLMKQKLPKIEGSLKQIYPSYQIIKKLNPKMNLENLFLSPIHCNKSLSTIHSINCLPKFQLLLWYLKDNELTENFMKHFIKIEKKLFIEDNKLSYLFTLIDLELLRFDDSSIYEDFKLQKISSNLNYYRFKKIGSILKDICNSLNKQEFKITIQTSLQLFQKCKQMIYNFYHLES